MIMHEEPFVMLFFSLANLAGLFCFRAWLLFAGLHSRQHLVTKRGVVIGGSAAGGEEAQGLERQRRLLYQGRRKAPAFRHGDISRQ